MIRELVLPASGEEAQGSHLGRLVFGILLWLAIWTLFWWYFLTPQSQPKAEFAQDVRAGGGQIDLGAAPILQTFVAREANINGIALYPYDYTLSPRARGFVRFSLTKDGAAEPLVEREVQVTSIPVSQARYIFRFPTLTLEKGQVYRLSLEGTGFAVWGNKKEIPGGTFAQPVKQSSHRDWESGGAASGNSATESGPSSLAFSLYGPPDPGSMMSSFLPWNADSYGELPRSSTVAWTVFAATIALTWLLLRGIYLPGILFEA